MALPYRTTGSLCPAFASARLVSLAVKHAYAIALLARCPTYLAYLRTPPLHFGRRPPQSNCLPCTVPDPDNGPRLEPQTHQGGISTLAPQDLATLLQSLPPILHRSVQNSIQSYSKGSWGLSVFPRGRLHHHKHFNFAESQEETVWPSLRHSCRSELTRQGISLP